MPAADLPLVELRGIRKSYGDLLVNDGVDLALHRGEVHSLLGENGAGKTTLMRILYGLTRPDAGEIRVDGSRATVAAPRDAIAHGIGMVTQHFALVKPMTVVENVILSTVGFARVDLAQARRRVLAAAERLGVRVDPDARVGTLSVGEQQRVEILKALYNDCRVLILDEPTAVLVPQDVDALFTTIRALTGQGLAVLFISHKLREVTTISDTISVLRRGRVVASMPNDGVDVRHLAELMVGRPALGLTERKAVPDPPSAPREVVLDVEGLTVPALHAPGDRRNALEGIDLRVRAGEIVGVAGVSGNGQRELVDALCGVRTPSGGSVRVVGSDVTGLGPAQVMAAGLGRIPEDRHGSVVAELSVEQNLVLEDLARYRRGPFLDRARMRRHAEDLIVRFSIKARPTDPVGALSGGNMQKVLLARVLARDPRAIVVAQPTRGLDVGAAEFVHGELLDRRAAGTGILLVSEDLEELLALSDRLVVIYEGRLVGEVDAGDATPQRLGLLMAGQVS